MYQLWFIILGANLRRLLPNPLLLRGHLPLCTHPTFVSSEFGLAPTETRLLVINIERWVNIRLGLPILGPLPETSGVMT